MAETINDLYKAEVIHRRRRWRSFEAVEYTTRERVDWLSHRWLFEPIEKVTSDVVAQQVYGAADHVRIAAWIKPKASGKSGAVHSSNLIENGANPI